MKNLFLKLILSISLIATPLLVTGCKTTQPSQAKIENQVQILAQTAGTIILIEKPELRAGFSNAVESLNIIANGTNEVTILEVLAVVQRLDIKELRSEKAILYVSTGLLLLTTYDVPTSIPLEESNNVRGIARSLAKGLTTAQQITYREPSLPPLPPLPPQ